MAKRYTRLNWQNAPSVATPRNATNLNVMDKGIDDCDNAIEVINASLAGLGEHTGVVIFPVSATGGAYHSSMMPLFGANTKTVAITAAVVIGEYTLTSAERLLLVVGKRTDGILLTCSDSTLSAKVTGKAVSITYTVS